VLFQSIGIEFDLVLIDRRHIPVEFMLAFDQNDSSIGFLFPRPVDGTACRLPGVCAVGKDAERIPFGSWNILLGHRL